MYTADQDYQASGVARTIEHDIRRECFSRSALEGQNI
jgi:hypothetical protein